MMRKVVDVALSGFTAALILSAVFILGPEMESRLWPAYSKFTLLSVEPMPEGQSKVVFRYTKLRQCVPQGFSWFLGEPGAANRQLKVVSADGKRSSEPRPVGENTSAPYIVDAAPDEFRSRAFAEIFSQCHPVWTTRSKIYP
jgi:hypothetical protein